MSRKRINSEAPLTPSQKNKRYYEKHKESELQRNRVYHQDNKSKVNLRHRNTRHRITQEWFDAKIEEQNNHCAVCQKEFQGTPHIDHNHQCCPKLRSCDKCRRDLLCEDCNLGLGRFFDSVTLMQNAIQYIERHNK